MQRFGNRPKLPHGPVLSKLCDYSLPSLDRMGIGWDVCRTTGAGKFTDVCWKPLSA